MIWTTPTHSFAATLCRKTGLPCPMAARLAQTLADALRKAEPATQPGFELTGTARLSGCGDGCTVRYVASHARIRLFCGVPETADQSPLDRLADAMFSDGPAARRCHRAPRFPMP